MKLRIILTIIILCILIATPSIYNAIQGPIEGEIAVRQLEDSIVEYSMSRSIIVSNLIPNIIYVVLMGFLVLIWISPIVKFIKKE